MAASFGLMYRRLRSVNSYGHNVLYSSAYNNIERTRNKAYPYYVEKFRTFTTVVDEDSFVLGSASEGSSSESFKRVVRPEGVFVENSEKGLYGIKFTDSFGRVTIRKNFLSEIEAEVALDEVKEFVADNDIYTNWKPERAFIPRKGHDIEGQEVASLLSTRCRQMLTEDELRKLYETIINFTTRINISSLDRLVLVRDVFSLLGYKSPQLFPLLKELLDLPCGLSENTAILTADGHSLPISKDDQERFLLKETLVGFDGFVPRQDLDDFVPFVKLQEDPDIQARWKAHQSDFRKRDVGIVSEFLKSWEEGIKDFNLEHFLEHNSWISTMSRRVESSMSVSNLESTKVSQRKQIYRKRKLKKALRESIEEGLYSPKDTACVSVNDFLSKGLSKRSDEEYSALGASLHNYEVIKITEFLELLSATNILIQKEVISMLRNFVETSNDYKNSNYLEAFCENLVYSFGQDEGNVVRLALCDYLGCETFKQVTKYKIEKTKIEEINCYKSSWRS